MEQRKPMQQHPIEAVIFDCDGTLVDSETLSISILLDFASEFGHKLAYEDTLQQFAGSDLAVVMKSIEQQIGHSLPDNFMDSFRARQLPILKDQLQAIHGAHELLDALDLPSCVASNAPLSKINVCLETTGLDRFFTEAHIFSAYQIETWKPSPDLFLMTAEFLQVAPERCAVVEDSGFGIEAGLAAGMQVFAYDPHDVHGATDQVTAVRCLTELIPTLCD
jgi:HAD superfamily hydrolase (TIGR01509 family)